jgi:hypothetical protein
VNYLRSLWYARLRKIDLKILWPSCKTLAPDLDHARAAFAMHALHDRAWTVLGEAEVCEIVDRLV